MRLVFRMAWLIKGFLHLLGKPIKIALDKIPSNPEPGRPKGPSITVWGTSILVSDAIWAYNKLGPIQDGVPEKFKNLRFVMSKLPPL